MNLVFDEDALADLEGIFAWIARNNPAAARRLIQRIFRKVERLLMPGMARMGRAGRDPGTRELVEGPYIIIYEIREGEDEIVILAVFHGARNRA
jgi:toxin ParE1/3/4